MPTSILSAAVAEAHFSVVGMFLFFFFAFALAAGIWLLLWMQIGGEAETSDESKDSGASEPEPVTEPENDPEPIAESKPAQDDDLPDFDTASDEQAAKQFSTELAEGIVRQDPVYGIVYNESPGSVDDLKKIKGVGKVLEGKLNGVGVYRFKQIAVWTDAACQEFSKMLTFKDRVYRDNWIEQAKGFHQEKYDEEL